MYGPGTSAIAIAIQKEIGLTVDGKVGPNTRAAETTSVTLEAGSGYREN